MAALTIRRAEAKDADLVIRFIHALAEYEKLAGPSAEGEARIKAHGWGDSPMFEVLLAFEDETAVGFAFYFYTYSTFAARPTLFLEDLFVYPDYRGRGHGKALLAALAKEAIRHDCGRMDWMVLDWNKSAIEFYESLGAEVLSEWELCRLTGVALTAMASAAASAV